MLNYLMVGSVRMHSIAPRAAKARHDGTASEILMGMKAIGSCLVVRLSILLLALHLAWAGTVQAAPAKSATKNVAAKKTTPASPADKPDKSKALYYLCTIELNPTEGALAAKDVVPLLGNIDPYSAKVRDAATLLIYSSNKVTPEDTCADRDLVRKVQAIAAGHSHVEEIGVTHGGSLDDMLKEVNNLIPDKNITVTAVGTDRIRIVRGPGVTDADYKAFKADIERIGWQMKNESSVGRVFYVSASDVSAALGGKGGSTSGGADSSGDKSGNSQTQTDTTTTTTINQVCLPQGAAAPPKPDPSATGDTASQEDSSSDSGSEETDKSGQSATPCAVTGTDKANKSGDTKGGGSQSSSSVSVTSVNDDLLVLTAPRGHDSDISEKKRLLATLDFPRPEVLLNIWSFQASSSRMEEVAKRARGLRRTIDSFNDGIQASIDKTWNEMQKNLSTSDGGFDSDLYPYLTEQYIGDYQPPDKPRDSLYVPAAQRINLGMCKSNTYCLGYSSLLRPAKPTLTDMLLAVIVAKQPATQMNRAIQSMQGNIQSKASFKADSDTSALTCEAADRYEIAKNVQVDKSLAGGDDRDNAPSQGDQNPRSSMGVGLPLHCFEAEAFRLFEKDPNDKGVTPRVRLLRAALANFLFHYKMSQQYPHEFSQYDLNQSAQELNSELNPLIVAFNRDISAMLDVLSHGEDQTETSNGWWGFGGHGSIFINNGVITVRTLSGKSTTVDALTQSVFDATNPPSITDLINSVGKAESNIPNVMKANLTAHEAATIIGALNSVTTAQSKIGREFKINITPRSLSGASSSELQVKLDAKESAEPTLYSNGSSSSDNISRVADHSVDTKVRLDSIKLFEISSFSAYLERSRRNFPILPPFFEIPYVGSILSLPLPGAREYHRSTAVISAIIVPTAIDIVSGIRFNFDRVITPAELPVTTGQRCTNDEGSAQSCNLRVALSVSDLSPYSIGAYHRATIACIATGDKNPFPGSALECGSLQLSSFYPER
jgi:hypothetical protein